MQSTPLRCLDGASSKQSQKGGPRQRLATIKEVNKIQKGTPTQRAKPAQRSSNKRELHVKMELTLAKVKSLSKYTKLSVGKPALFLGHTATSSLRMSLMSAHGNISDVYN